MTIEEINKERRIGDIKEVAAAAGVHFNTVRNHLSGKHTPKPDTERLLLEAWAAVITERRKWKADLKRRLSIHNKF